MEFVTCPNCEKTYPKGYGVCPFCGEAAPPENQGPGETDQTRDREDGEGMG